MKNNDSVLLSISILMSGRKETRQCLESLVPIMEKVPSELILVDTGCDEETKKILEEYTDIIIPFKWCDDFSKARNVGLERATGEWFMFLDDDEWFEDTSEIIDFFTSGEYKEYRSASYKVRNYITADGKHFTDSYARRMTQKFDNTRFFGIIHEQLEPIYNPEKLFNSYVNHYGYVYSSQQDLYKDSNRNLNLLKKEIKDKPNDLRTRVLLLQEYRRLQELDNVIEFALESVEICNSEMYEEQDISWKLGCFYAYVLDAYEKKYNYKKELAYLDEISSDARINELTRAFLYKSEIVAGYELGSYERVYEAFMHYIELYKNISNDLEINHRQGGPLVCDVFQKRNYRIVICNGILSAMKLDKEKMFKEYFDELELESNEICVHPDFVEEMMEYILSKEKCNEYVYYIDRITRSSMCLNQLIDYAMKLEDDIEKKDKYENVIKILAQIENEHWYFTYVKIINANIEGNRVTLTKLYSKLFSQVEDIFNLNECIWQIAENNKLDMSTLINNIDYDKWQRGINNWISTSGRDSIENIVNYVNKWNIVDNIRIEYFYMSAKEGLLLKVDKENCDFAKLERDIVGYARSVKEYYSRLYKKEIFEQMSYVLPKQCRFALDILDIVKIRKEDGKEALEKLKDTVGRYGYYVDVINIYSKLLGEKIISDNKVAKKAKQEMLDLALILKIKAREYIENGDLDQARVILYNVIQNIPNDEEAQEILEMISD